MSTFECGSSRGCIRKVLGLKGLCRAERLKNKNMCIKTDDTSPKFNPAFVALLTDKEEEPQFVRTIVKGEESKFTVNSNVAESLAINKAIKECKHRSVKSTRKDENGIERIIHTITNDDGSSVEYGDCGCGMNRCGLLKGKDGFVGLNDCRQCVIDRGLVTLDPPPRNPGLGESSIAASAWSGFAGQVEPSLRDGQ